MSADGCCSRKGQAMKKKKTNIKIKRSKYNLYNKKKSRGKQVLAVVVTIIAAAVLAVVGYGIGRPLMEYFQGRESGTSESTPSWTPPQTAEPTAESTDPTAESTEESAEPTSDDQGSVMGTMYILSESAAANSESLASAIAAAKSSGCTGVVVTLKDDSGNLLYKSEIDGVKDGSTITGTLTAKQICGIVTAAGLTPAARISTVLDSLNGNYVGGNFVLSDGGGNWLDAALADDGKKWLNPFEDDTCAFMENIAAELSEAGFRYIIAADTMFPDFHPSDYTTYLYSEPISDADKRIEALWNVLDSVRRGAESGGAVMVAEVDADALFADDKQGTDAEIAADKSKLSEVTLLIDYTADSSSSSPYADAKAFIGKMKAAYSSQEYAVLVKGTGFSDSTLTEIKRAFSEAEIDIFVQQ